LQKIKNWFYNILVIDDYSKLAMILRTDLGNGVLILSLNDSNHLNVLSKKLIQQLNTHLIWAEKQSHIKVIIITGEGRAFSAGADLKEFIDWQQNEDFVEDWQLLSTIEKPTIAAVNGFALGGGCELALMTDIICASERAIFSQPEITLNTIPGGGGTQRLPRKISKAWAMEMCLTGDKINAEIALKIGLVNHVFPHQDLINNTLIIASRIAQFHMDIIKNIKRLVKQADTGNFNQGMRLERDLFYQTFSMPEQQQAIKNFLNH
jgi:enoyl-CoA hydratase